MNEELKKLRNEIRKANNLNDVQSEILERIDNIIKKSNDEKKMNYTYTLSTKRPKTKIWHKVEFGQSDNFGTKTNKLETLLIFLLNPDYYDNLDFKITRRISK